LKKESGKTAPESKPFWFSLDNAAKIFPAVITREVTSVFRLSVVLKQPVRMELLQKAVLQAEDRFPYYLVQLKEGFFWYYLEHLSRHIPIIADEHPTICRRFRKGELLLRILVRKNRISLEGSHILTDGAGAFIFFRTILLLYFEASGIAFPEGGLPHAAPEVVSAEEYEDAYKRYFKDDIPSMVKRSKAFHLPFTLNSRPRFRQTTATFPMSQMKQAAKEKGVSITVYLVAVYLHTLQEIHNNLGRLNRQRKCKRLRVQVPVNLRKIFPSKTMRNFSLFVMPEIDLRLGQYSFDEIIKTVYHQMQLESDEKLINKNIARNVGGEKKRVVRGIPLFLKSFILRMKYYSLGTGQYSGVITNLGKVDLPEETRELIDHLIIIPPPPNKMLKLNCGVIGFGDKLVLSFGNITRSNEFEERFLHFLTTHHISVETETKTDQP
jgi:hypothetical protein